MTTRGFALIAVLWTITALTAVVGLGLGATRLGQRTTLNRLALTRGRWAAEACVAIAQARFAEHQLRDTASVDLGRATWCAWQVSDPTARLNVNTADRDVLAVLLCGAETGPCVADTIVRWRAVQPYQNLTELPNLDSSQVALLTIDGPGSVNVNAAPAVILRALPGLTPEAVTRLFDRRALGRAYGSLDALAADLSSAARSALLARYADLSRTITFDAPQLALTVEGWVTGAGAGAPGALHARIALLAVPLPDRLAIVRRRMW